MPNNNPTGINQYSKGNRAARNLRKVDPRVTTARTSVARAMKGSTPRQIAGAIKGLKLTTTYAKPSSIAARNANKPSSLTIKARVSVARAMKGSPRRVVNTALKNLKLK